MEILNYNLKKFEKSYIFEDIHKALKRECEYLIKLNCINIKTDIDFPYVVVVF